MRELALFPDFAAYQFLLRPHGPDDPLNLDNYNNLLPLEKALVAHSVTIRKAEFGDGRWCAHQALKELGRDTGSPILRGDRGMPLWPAAVSGSLTHTNGYRGAVVAPRLLVRSLGRMPNLLSPCREMSSVRSPCPVSVSLLSKCGPHCPTLTGSFSVRRRPPTKPGSRSPTAG